MENHYVAMLDGELGLGSNAPTGLELYLHNPAKETVEPVPVYAWLLALTGSIHEHLLRRHTIRISASELCRVREQLIRKFKLTLLADSPGGDFMLGQWLTEAMQHASSRTVYGVHDVSSAAAYCTWKLPAKRKIHPDARSIWHPQRKLGLPAQHPLHRKIEDDGRTHLESMCASAITPFDAIFAGNIRAFSPSQRAEFIFSGRQLIDMGLAEPLSESSAGDFYDETAWPKNHEPVKRFWSRSS